MAWAASASSTRAFGGFGVAAGVEHTTAGFALLGGVPAVISVGLILVGSGIGGRGEVVEPIGLARADGCRFAASFSPDIVGGSALGCRFVLIVVGPVVVTVTSPIFGARVESASAARNRNNNWKK